MILDVRGTHGSGKSYVMHQLLKNNEHEEIVGRCEYRKKNIVLGYYLYNLDCVIIGKYLTACGGCDGVGQADEICRRVRMFAEEYSIVMLEGILVAHTFKRYSDLANEIKANGEEYKFLFLDTPLEVCIERVEARRHARGKTGPFDPKNVVHDHRQIWTRTRQKMKEAGQTVIEVPYKKSYQTVVKEMECQN